jgi:arylsulfatase A-like enzyme
MHNFTFLSPKQVKQSNLFFLGLVLSALPAIACADTARPNIIFILADDLGTGDVKCFYPASKVTTPNIDRLASEGMRFTQAYAPGATCSPSRYALISGAFPCRGPLRSQTASSYSPLTISVDALTLPKFLKNQGYRTAHIGKWHLGFGENGITNWAGEIKPGALEIGFDYHFALPSNHNDNFKTYVENHRLLWLKESITDLPDKPTINQLTQVRYDDEVESTLTSKGINFIRENREGPFFLYLALTATHTHITPHKKFRGTSELGQLGDYINELDFHVGEIMGTLEDLGIEENTIIFFSSDNGGAPNDHSSAGKNLSLRDSSQQVAEKSKTAKTTASKKLDHQTNGDLRGSKGSNYEGGHRVPYIVRWPNQIAAGSESDQIITLADTLATVSGFLESPFPKADGPDSFDLSPVMLGKTAKGPKRPGIILQTSRGALAFRQGDWKLRFPKATAWKGLKATLPTQGPELYNLSEDPGEQNNLSSREPERVGAMSARLLDLLNRGRSH